MADHEVATKRRTRRSGGNKKRTRDDAPDTSSAPAPAAVPKSKSKKKPVEEDSDDGWEETGAQFAGGLGDIVDKHTAAAIMKPGYRKGNAFGEKDAEEEAAAAEEEEEEEYDEAEAVEAEEAEEFEEDAASRREHGAKKGRKGEEAAEEEGEDQPSTSFKLLKSNVPANHNYDELNLNPLSAQALRSEFKFEKLTEVQAKCIPVALSGKDLLAEAKTGAGKTLAFLIPIVELLCRAGFKARNGTGGIVIGPTRELCQQIEGVLLRLLKFYNGSITFLCCIGGINRKTEGFKLTSGQQIVVSTPGRLLDHLSLTTEWNHRNLLVLCVDEADRVLDNGFEQDMRDIVARLPKKRQTFLFSATQTTRVEQLARVSFQRQPLFVSLKSKEDKATVDTLEQGYVVCESERRFLLLYHFIKKNLKKKVIIFFSSRNSVSYHAELLNYIDIPCVAFHGKQKQHQRSATYMQFCNAPSGVMLTTDVSARGLDIPKVDWIVQFDPPDDPVKYIHRVGRTARAGNCGNALMFLLPSEKMFLKYLYQDAKVAVNEFVFKQEKLNDQLQTDLEKLVQSNYYLRQTAHQAYEGYLLAYSASQLKNVFNIQELDLARVARGFGLLDPPPLKIDLTESAAHLNKKARKEFRQGREAGDDARRERTAGGRGFGRGGGGRGGRGGGGRGSSDGRQFSR